jgi:hypothetical protein
MARDDFGALLRMASSGGRARPERSCIRQLGSFDLRHNNRTAEQQMSFAELAAPVVLVSVARFFAAFRLQVQPGKGFGHRAECRRVRDFSRRIATRGSGEPGRLASAKWPARS